jgi:adenylate cyclase
VLTIRRLRAASGLVLLTYIGLHLANHALGLVSVGTADTVRRVMHALWHSPPGTVLLYGSLVVHMALAFVAVWTRRSLRLPPVEVLRLVLGFGLPLLLYMHVAATRLLDTLFAIDAPYARVVNALAHWNAAPLQLALIAIAWTHGCIGVAIMLRANPNARRYSHAAVAAAVLLPVLGALGFLAMARELAVTGAWRARFESGVAGAVRLTTGGQVLQVPRGWSVLEASDRHGVPHLSLCGGRARCSTCRVRVAGPAVNIPPPNADEARTLRRIHAAPDVRLACQLRPLGDIAFEPQLTAHGADGPRVTHERDVAVLFVDLRRWSTLAEGQWPHDLVYVLDRYFALVGGAVRACGGEPNQFIGDSVMAIFGLETDLPTACAQAFRAATRIHADIAAWRAEFEAHFPHGLAIGIGLHAGPAVVTEVGYRETTSVTAVGEVVNTASRLQEQTKASGAWLVASADAIALGGVVPDGAERTTVAVRGRSAPLDVVCFTR